MIGAKMAARVGIDKSVKQENMPGCGIHPIMRHLKAGAGPLGRSSVGRSWLLTALVPFSLLALWSVLATAAPPRTASTAAPLMVADVKGSIDPPMADYLDRVLRLARQRGCQAVIVRLNTPGGSLDPTKQMFEALLNSQTPNVVYVSPRGAFAASAGTFVTLAATVAAMAPGATIGAAHPISLGGQQQPPAKGTDTLTQKLVNATSSMIRSIAQQRSRNADWAEKAVRQSVSATASEALKLGVVDLVATDMGDLLAKLDGRQVKQAGRTVTLHTVGAPLIEEPPNLQESFLHVLANPNVALVLMSLGTLGIIFELSNPGAILPGIVGVICLVLGFYAFSMIPIHYAGLALIGFAIALFIADIKVPSHGFLTAGGIISFLLGAFMLTWGAPPGMRLALPVILTTTAVTAAFFIFLVQAGLRAQFRRVTTGTEGLIGAVGQARTALDPRGTVFLQGELWKAVAEEPVAPGAQVVVVAVDGFTLKVRPRA